MHIRCILFDVSADAPCFFISPLTRYNFVELSRVRAGGKLPSLVGGGAGADCNSCQPCSLSAPVAALVELLFSEDAILSSMQAAHIKVDELPLGAVTVDRVLRCSALLEAIRSHLETSQTQAPREGAVWQAQLEQFSTDFFQQLPCRDVQLIKTEADLAAREATVNLLMDVAVGQGLLTKAGKNGAAAVASSLSSLSSSAQRQ